MLQELSIRNFAIIEDLNIRFESGLTILSGETGAGKSIIINAVNLLLGSRVSPGLIRSGAQTAELEAQFVISRESLTAKTMAELGYDAGEGLLVRRIISRKDRHRIYINGRLATGQILSAITANLASISGQHAHQGLLKEEQHLTILDQYGGLLSLREAYAACYDKLLPMIEEEQQLLRPAGSLRGADGLA
jgi:DNA repair protein RecN (Recombination protein N)